MKGELYIHKSTEVRAKQYVDNTILDFMKDEEGKTIGFITSDNTLAVPTHHGETYCEINDFVVRNDNGEYYPVDYATFMRSYEKIKMENRDIIPFNSLTAYFLGKGKQLDNCEDNPVKLIILSEIISHCKEIQMNILFKEYENGNISITGSEPICPKDEAVKNSLSYGTSD